MGSPFAIWWLTHSFSGIVHSLLRTFPNTLGESKEVCYIVSTPISSLIPITCILSDVEATCIWRGGTKKPVHQGNNLGEAVVDNSIDSRRWTLASILFLSAWAVMMGPLAYGKSMHLCMGRANHLRVADNSHSAALGFSTASSIHSFILWIDRSYIVLRYWRK